MKSNNVIRLLHIPVTCVSKKHALSYKQLRSGLSPQKCLYFTDSKLLSSCLVNWLYTVNAGCILITFQGQPLSVYS